MQVQVQNDIRDIHELVQRESAFVDVLLAEASKVIVGQKPMLEALLIGMLTGGHVLLEGVPGLAKTLTVKTLADTMEAEFKRIQFTPDLLPADLVGTQIYSPQNAEFTVRKGPVFANIVLADEINRAPAKVQSALLEAMQERQVTIGDTTFALPRPFLVLATQNPIEQEGTYPLPEAQVDRFMMLVKVGYPTPQEERQIMDRMGQGAAPVAQKVLGLDAIERAAKVVSLVYVDDKVKDYIVRIVHASREPQVIGLPHLRDWIEFGASPRASIALIQAARAHAFLRHRGFVTPEDIKAVGYNVLRHRISLSYEAEAEEVSSEQIIQTLFEKVEVP